jgi:hypothetical protein
MIQVFDNTVLRNVTMKYHSHRSPGFVRKAKGRRGDKILVKSFKMPSESYEKIKMDPKKVTLMSLQN